MGSDRVQKTNHAVSCMPSKDFGFQFERDGKSLESFEQRTDMIGPRL